MSCLCRYLTPERAAKAGVTMSLQGKVCAFCSKQPGVNCPSLDPPPPMFCECGEELPVMNTTGRCFRCACGEGLRAYWADVRNGVQPPPQRPHTYAKRSVTSA